MIKNEKDPFLCSFDNVNVAMTPDSFSASFVVDFQILIFPPTVSSIIEDLKVSNWTPTPRWLRGGGWTRMRHRN